MAEEYGTRFEGSRTYEIAKRLYSAPVTVVERSVTVGTNLTEILKHNPRRLHWILCNRGINSMSLGFTQEVTYAAGFLLAANGGVMSMIVTEDSEAVCFPVYGITETGSSLVYVVEVVGL